LCRKVLEQIALALAGRAGARLRPALAYLPNTGVRGEGDPMFADMDTTTMNRIGLQLIAIGEDMEREWAKFRQAVENGQAGIGVDPLGTTFMKEYLPAELSVQNHADPLPALWQADGYGATISVAIYVRADQAAASQFAK
jgi:hypothetical protein